MEIADSIDKIIDVSVEQDKILSEKLKQLSQKHNAVLMACVASYVGHKVSPTKTVNAQMGLCDEFAVETAINCNPEHKKYRAGRRSPILNY